MKEKTIAIIGSGMGGLAAGIYGRLNGYETHIFEMHTAPGGQCTAWKRKGYTFDACIHHLFGCGPNSSLYRLWEELGAAPREFVPLQECVSVLSTEGRLFRDYYNLDQLEGHMNELAPADSRVIRDYVNGIRATARSDFMGKTMQGSRLALVKALPGLLTTWRWFKPTMAQYGERFSDPFLRRAIPQLIYCNPSFPIIFHLTRHAYGLDGTLKWPVGGAAAFAGSIERRYLDLGGSIHYRSKVAKILTEDGRAVGIRLDDGSEHRADVVISNADGRTTIDGLLDGRFVDKRTRAECLLPNDDMPFAVQVFLGVNRNLSHEPSSMVMLLDEPVTLANHTCHDLEVLLYGFDPTMAPAGKGVMKIELHSQYSWWKDLAGDRERYAEAKQKLADRIVDLLERWYFTGLRQQVEVIDVATLLTWERFTGGTMGLGIYPHRKFSPFGGATGDRRTMTLPGLSQFYFAGTWATNAGALFLNALSGKRVVQAICRSDGRKFVSR